MEEKFFCPQCGAANNRINQFCGTCGTRLQGAQQITPSQTTTDLSTNQPPANMVYVQTQPSAQVVFVQPQQPKIQKITAIGITGLIFGIVSVLILSWLSLFSYIFLPFVYLIFPIIGIILSAISIKHNSAIGIVGLVLGIIGLLIQIAWCIFVIFAFLMLF